MRVLFIYPDVGTMVPPEYQHGVGILISLLKGAGHGTRLLYVHEEPTREQLIEDARSFGPDLIAVSTATNQYPRARQFAAWLKEALPAPIVIGGIHATLAPEPTIAEPCFDLLCRGEGEQALLELVTALAEGRDHSGIENLWVKHDGEIIKNPVRPLLEDLDSLPFADREEFHFEEILAAQGGRASLLSGRGCPFGCTYCANLGLRALYKGKGPYVRMRSVTSILAEMKAIRERYDVQKWDFNDDVFTLDKKWVAEFCERYPAEFDLPFDVNVRVETVDREMLFALKSAGCEWIRVGVESGSDRVRKQVMGRSMSEDRIIKVFDDAKEAGLKAWSFNMVGLPGETEDDAEQTWRLNRRLCPDHMQVSVFNPYPGTGLYDECVERGAITGEVRDGYFLPDSRLHLPEFPAERIYAMHQKLIRLRDECHSKNKLLRELGGPPALDLVDSLAQARVTAPEPIFVGEDFFTIGTDTRRTLRLHPPARVRYHVVLPRRAELRLALAMHPQVLERGAGRGVTFTIRAGRFQRTMKEIFRLTIDPKNNPLDRGWLDRSINLGAWSGKKVWLELTTALVDPGSPEHQTVGLGHPVIVERKP